MSRLALPAVTLCAVTSVNLPATIAALQACMKGVDFAEVLLLTDREPAALPPGISKVAIRPLNSAADYSQFMLCELAAHISTDHCLVVQWDGFIINPGQWDQRFLDVDFVGAPWPQFTDGHDVGNGGFSLRSRKLLRACASPGFVASHPEDVAIGRINREYLEREHDIRFADRGIAERFAFERAESVGPTFGFHGVFNMVDLLGQDCFWALYETLDDKSSVFRDYRLLMKQSGPGAAGLRRKARLTLDRLGRLLGGSDG